MPGLRGGEDEELVFNRARVSERGRRSSGDEWWGGAGGGVIVPSSSRVWPLVGVPCNPGGPDP